MWRRIPAKVILALICIPFFLAAVCDSGDGDDGDVDDGGNDVALLRNFSLPLPLFAANSAWNQPADQANALGTSDQQILALYRVLLGDNTSLQPSGTGLQEPFPFMYVNYDEYSMPIYLMGTDQQTVLLKDYEGNPSGLNNPKLPIAPDGTVDVPAPDDDVRPSGPADTDADGHLVLYDPDSYVEYDYWNATTAQDVAGNSLGGGRQGPLVLAAGAIDFFDVRESGTNLAGLNSARAMGTPLLAGLLIPEDIEAGQINHALAFAIPGPRNLALDPYEPLESDYFYPATTTETDYYSTDPNALAAGQRIRLKPSLVDELGQPIDESSLAPITQMFLQALRKYGAYLVDNAGSFTFWAEDIHTAQLDLPEDEVNTLIGQSAATALPANKTKWQAVMEKLNEELETIPLAYSAIPNQDPATATFDIANFEVVENATVPEP